MLKFRLGRAALAAAALVVGVAMAGGQVQAATTYYQAEKTNTCTNALACTVSFPKLTAPVLINHATCNFYYWYSSSEYIQITGYELTDGTTNYYLGQTYSVAYGVPVTGQSNVEYSQYQTLSEIQFVVLSGKTPTIKLNLTESAKRITIDCVLSGINLS